jgi:hypothetical protein
MKLKMMHALLDVMLELSKPQMHCVDVNAFSKLRTRLSAMCEPDEPVKPKFPALTLVMLVEPLTTSGGITIPAGHIGTVSSKPCGPAENLTLINFPYYGEVYAETENLVQAENCMKDADGLRKELHTARVENDKLRAHYREIERRSEKIQRAFEEVVKERNKLQAQLNSAQNYLRHAAAVEQTLRGEQDQVRKEIEHRSEIINCRCTSRAFDETVKERNKLQAQLNSTEQLNRAQSEKIHELEECLRGEREESCRRQGLLRDLENLRYEVKAYQRGAEVQSGTVRKLADDINEFKQFMKDLAGGPCIPSYSVVNALARLAEKHGVDLSRTAWHPHSS